MNAGSVSYRGGDIPCWEVDATAPPRDARSSNCAPLPILRRSASARVGRRGKTRSEDAVGRARSPGMTLTRLFPGDEDASSRARSGRRGGGDAWRRGFEPVATGREETRKRVERTSPSSGRAGRVREWRLPRGGRAWGVCFLSSRSVYDSRNAPICEKDYRVLLCVTEYPYALHFPVFSNWLKPAR